MIDKIQSRTVYEDYPPTFSWKKLFHKLCFEQMLENFTKLAQPAKDLTEGEEQPAPFKIFYEYINKIGDQIEVLRIPSMDKTKLKSNHFWIMPTITKLVNLRVIKMHKHNDHYVGPDFFNFLRKGTAKLA